jgi:hypothetical protein
MRGSGGGPALTIDRLIVTGAALTSERAERLRALVELEVRRRLAHPGLPDDLRDTGVVGVQAPAVALHEPDRDGAAAALIAEHVVQALRGGPVSSRGS